MANVIYNSFKKDNASALIDLETDAFKVMLVTSTYVPNIDTHSHREDITNEVVGTGYVAGGKSIANPTVTQDDANDRAVWDGDDVVWAASEITARGAVIYQDVGTAATDRLVTYLDFGTDQTSTGGDFNLNFNAIGIMTLT